MYRFKAENFNQDAADHLKQLFQELQQKKGEICIALSGGTTPIPILEILRTVDLEWNRFNFFLVDERCVPLTHSDSNYRNINNSFFKHIESNNYTIINEEFSIDESIEAYKEKIISIVDLDDNGKPSFDLIVLGMGEDGHTASLFPGTKALKEQIEFVTLNYVPQLDGDRITLTYPVLKNAKEILVLARGTKKVKIVDELYSTHATKYPMYELVDSHVKINWIVSE